MTQAREAKKKTADPLERWKPEEHHPNETSRQHSLLHLQRAAGNRAVVQLLESHGQLQTKLRISGLGDEHEHQADRAAEQVLRLTSASTGVVQPKCSACSPAATCAECAEEEETVQRKTKSAPVYSSTGPVMQRKAKNSSVLSSTAPHIQRAPNNGESTNATTSDAAIEPAAVASGPLIVEDDAASVGPGQMRKSDFLEQLRSTVCTTADEALKEAGQSTEGCPYIEKWLDYYSGQEPAHIERALRKYAPEAASATSARDIIPAVSNRVRVAVDRWARTGEITGVPPEMAGMLPGAGGALGAVAGMIGGAVAGIGSAIGGAVSAAAGAVGSAFSSIGSALFKRKEGNAGPGTGATHDADDIQQRLSGGQSLDGGLSSRMGAAFGHDFSSVRVHTNAEAAGLSDSLNARAFTIGSDIAFGPGEYQPGTLIGDALIAHELAHVVQQSGGGNGSTAPQSKGSAGHDALEEEADVAAVGAVSALWLGAQGSLANIGRHAAPRLRSGLQLQSCSKKKSYPAVDVSRLPAGGIRSAVAELSQSDEEIDRNTARQVAEGNIHAYYYEDLAQPSDVDAKLRGYGYDPAVLTIYLQPITGAEMVVQRNAEGSAHGMDIFGKRTLSVERWKTLLVHETNHAVNQPFSNALDRYKSEFRAYWLAEYRGVSDLNDRARQIREHILRDYAVIKTAYDSDPAVKTAIDSYTRPEADVTNVTGLNVTPPTAAGR